MRKTFVVGLVVSMAAACNTGSDTGSSVFPSPSTTPTTEMFTGTVDVGGSDSHPFTIALSGGQVNVTLTAAGPPQTIYMGLGVGAWSSPTCTLIAGASTAVPAGATAQLSGTANAGSFCVMVYDVGNQTTQVTYAVTVTHF
jgi:hypothetical protein